MHHSSEKNGAIFFWRVKPANPLPYILAQKVSTKVLMIPKGQILFCIYHVASYFRYPSFQFAITNSPCVISINIRFFSRKWGKPLIIYYLHAIRIFSFQQIECFILSVFFSKLRFILVMPQPLSKDVILPVHALLKCRIYYLCEHLTN